MFLPHVSNLLHRAGNTSLVSTDKYKVSMCAWVLSVACNGGLVKGVSKGFVFLPAAASNSQHKPHPLFRTPFHDLNLQVAIKLGVQPRDLRLLDPAMASVSPPAILDRERAIVVNMGPIKW